MNLKLVIDLRSDFERQQEPNDFEADPRVEVLSLPIIDLIGSAMPPHNDMAEFYLALLHHGQDVFHTLFTRMANCDGMVLFHCTAGKDRSGVVAALLLSLAEVEDQDIIADYEISYTLIKPIIDQIRHVARELDINRLKSIPSHMKIFLQELALFGGAERYLREQCSLSQETLYRLKEKLIASPSAPEGNALIPYRRLPIPGIANLRDLGGYPRSKGGMTSWGQCYRSAAPEAAIPESSAEELYARGVRTIIDLRSAGEVLARPNPTSRGRPLYTDPSLPG